MEDKILDTILRSEIDSLAVDLADFYDQDIYDIPDPGVLIEKNELGLLGGPEVPQLFTNSQRWRSMSLRSRARLLWLHLRAYLHDIVEKEKRAELRVARMTHGLEPLRRLEVETGLCSVAQDPVGERFMVLDGDGYLHQHTKDGWEQAKLKPPVVLNGLATVSGPLGELGRFVGWGPAGLSILGEDFHLLWLSQPRVRKSPDQEPFCCLPVPTLGLLIVAQMGGSLELWKFRSGGRRLVPCGSPLQPPPSLAGSLKCLALGLDSDHCSWHCFAAYGSAVLTFDLDDWALINVSQDLHKTIISDLDYCEEISAMVTASRDSTVKVWEADWQIRMVFVGHTGPVTAMMVLPNSTLAVSASQDGTIRTWDLQAEAQVGEVTLDYWTEGIISEKVSRLLAPASPGWPVLSLCSKSIGLWRVRTLYSPLAQLSAPVLHIQVAPVLPAPTEPSLPARLVCACADGSVYLVSATTGRTVSSLLLEPEDCAAGVVYCLSREALWVLTRSGHLVRANAARCPMVVVHRLRPPLPPAPQPCCLHLYSHLTDPRSAFACWEMMRENQGDMIRSAIAWAWKNKNRFLPVMGHSDGTLSVLDWRTSTTIFVTEAHSPGPVTAIGSTWNSIVTSGADLTVKMWRVFPYAEECLSLLRTFSCCHPVVMLCVLGKRITVGFEDPESATYGLVQFGLGDKMRCDHRPQDDPMDHITGLCCCPTLKIYACSSLDCTIRIWTRENLLLRVALPFGYYKTPILQQPVLKEDLEDIIARDQDLQELRQGLVVPAARPPLSPKQRDEAFDNYLHLIYGSELMMDGSSERESSQWGTAAPSTEKEPPDMADMEIQPGTAAGVGQAALSIDIQAASAPSAPQTPRAPGRRFARPPRVSLPIPPTHRKVHSQASQLLARSSLSYELGLGLDLQVQWDQFGVKTTDLDKSIDYMKNRVPLLLPRRPAEPLSKLTGFFPATVKPYKLLSRPIRFPGCVPNSVVLRQMWLQAEVNCLGSLEELGSQSKFKSSGSEDDKWLKRRKRSSARWRTKLFGLLRLTRRKTGAEEGEEQEEEEEEVEVEYISSSPASDMEPERWEPDTESTTDLISKFYNETSKSKGYSHPRHSLLEDRYGHLPKFLHYFVVQNWFKKLFPIFTLEAYPEMDTIEGLASMLLDFLLQATWDDRVNILNGLLRLLPDVTGNLRIRLQAKLLYLLNQDDPPKLQDRTQKEFVMLALQLLLACSLDVLDVILEIISYYLYSPASCREELKNLLEGMGLYDPDGLLFKEIMTWVEDLKLESKEMIRAQCQQKLEAIFLQMQNLEQSTDGIFVEPSRQASQTSLISGATLPALSTSWTVSQASEMSLPFQESLMSSVPSPSAPMEPIELTDSVGFIPELPATSTNAHFRIQKTKKALADMLQNFCLEASAYAAGPGTPRRESSLAQSAWSHLQTVDMYPIDMLNLFCERLRALQKRSLVVVEEEEEEEKEHLPESLRDQPRPNVVLRPPRERWLYPILRLQEAKARGFSVSLRDRKTRRKKLTPGSSIRMLKLPLPRVNLQPFPPGWPTPPRALPPLLLQPTLQRYFLFRDTDPAAYR
uniref:WD repeat domain 97 n=1 Tax=Rattus norvegicus TaxID=10116 RepID=UPI0034CD9C4E